MYNYFLKRKVATSLPVLTFSLLPTYFYILSLPAVDVYIRFRATVKCFLLPVFVPKDEKCSPFLNILFWIIFSIF